MKHRPVTSQNGTDGYRRWVSWFTRPCNPTFSCFLRDVPKDYWKVAKSSGCRIILVHKDWETQAPVFFSCLASVSSVYRGYLSLSKTRRSKETRSMSEHSLVWNQHIFHFPSKTVSEVKEIARPVNSASVDSAAFQLQSSSHGTNKIRTATSELYWLYCLVLQSLFHLSDNHVKPIHKLYTSVWLQLVQLAVHHHIGCT